MLSILFTSPFSIWCAFSNSSTHFLPLILLAQSLQERHAGGQSTLENGQWKGRKLDRGRRERCWFIRERKQPSSFFNRSVTTSRPTINHLLVQHWLLPRNGFNWISISSFSMLFYSSIIILCCKWIFYELFPPWYSNIIVRHRMMFKFVRRQCLYLNGRDSFSNGNWVSERREVMWTYSDHLRYFSVIFCQYALFSISDPCHLQENVNLQLNINLQ